MVKDDQQYIGPSPPPGRPGRGLPFQLAAVVLTGACLAGATGFWAAGWLRQAGDAQAPPGRPSSGRHYNDWPKPDLAIVLSGEMHGYLQPCGCSDPQKGGLARRYNLMQTLTKGLGWNVVAGDLGDLAKESGPQALLKYRYAMEALQKLRYTAVGIGETETMLPLFNALGVFALNDHSPRVLSANLNDKDKKFPSMVGSIETAGGENGVPKVAFVSVVGASVAETMKDADVKFDPVDKVLTKLAGDLKATNAEIRVLLYQGSEDEAKAYAQASMQNPNVLPEFQIILWHGGDIEPRSQPETVGNALLMSVGHKGQYVGIAGAYRTGKANQPYAFRYELVAINPEFETPQGQDQNNPIHALMQKYAQEVRDENYLAKYPHDAKHPVQIAYPDATYVGSDACQGCHQHAYDIWKNSPHSSAYDTLVTKAKRPNLRQFDGECVVCHVTGFGYKSGFEDDKKTPTLVGVGCESCHGPASMHVDKPKDPKFRAALNPLKPKPGDNPQVVLLRHNDACMKCHDLDNSVHFNYEEFWKKIVHETPRKAVPKP
jgi:hypothetical protein